MKIPTDFHNSGAALTMIEIDGSLGEGGGQVLRTSLSLSALTGKPLRVYRIRENRQQPGLRPQHVTAVNAIAEITRADVHGARVKAPEVTLIPSGIRPGKYAFNIPTAGALTLVLQTVFLPLSFAKGTSRVTLTGGTHVQWSPIFHYIQEQWLPMMKSLGFRLELSLTQSGFFPHGGGEVTLKVLPVKTLLPYCCCDRGALASIRGLSGFANLEESIAKRQKYQTLKRLYAVCRDSKIKTMHISAAGKGTFVLLKANFESCGSACYTALGAPGKPAEHVADEAVDQLMNFLATEGCVDQYLADQLLLPLSVTKGVSEFRTNLLTEHLLTNAQVIQQFIPAAIKIEGEKGGPGIISLKGSPSQTANQPM
jgi:RNA 3'-terminal phosphate cyclase (ATP)